MRKPSGRTVVLQLIRAYEEEDRLYCGIEQAVVEQRKVLMNGRDPVKLNELVEVQRGLAEEIGRIESGIIPLREHMERILTASPGGEVQALADELDTILERLAARIHAIVEVEKDNTQELLEPAPNSRIS
jgi:hypothetical protein